MPEIYYWHIHHRELCEALTEPLKNRVAYIKANKPKNEIPIRLNLIRKVKDQKKVREIFAKMYALRDEYNAKMYALRDEYNAKEKPLQDEYDAKVKPFRDEYNAKVDALWDEYDAKVDDLWDEYYAKKKPLWDEYYAKKKPLRDELEALHKLECPDCPWDGETIFPGDAQ